MIAGGAPAWAVWLALGLWGLALVLGIVVAVMGRRLWRQLGPALGPLLAMFATPTISVAVARCEYTGVEGDRCELPAEHDGPHEWPTLNEALRA